MFENLACRQAVLPLGSLNSLALWLHVVVEIIRQLEKRGRVELDDQHSNEMLKKDLR